MDAEYNKRTRVLRVLGFCGVFFEYFDNYLNILKKL